jgi:hypothetical protein
MNIYKELKKNIIAPSLKKSNFKPLGNVWYRELETGVIHIIEISNITITINDFGLYINFGIYYKGVMELSYGFDLNLKNGVANCMFRGGMEKQEIKEIWNSNDFSSYETFAEDVLRALVEEKKMISFLDSITTGEQLLKLFVEPIEYYIKSDSLLALQIGCLHFLLGRKNVGKKIVEQVIAAYGETKYEFAEKVLMRMSQ